MSMDHIKDIKDDIEHLHAIISNLNERLTPALLPLEPCASAPANTSVEIPDAPLNDHLKDIKYSIHLINQRLSGLLEQIRL